MDTIGKDSWCYREEQETDRRQDSSSSYLQTPFALVPIEPSIASDSLTTSGSRRRKETIIACDKLPTHHAANTTNENALGQVCADVSPSLRDRI